MACYLGRADEIAKPSDAAAPRLEGHAGKSASQRRVRLDLMEREAKLLGLDAEMRNHVERPVSAPHRGTVFDLLAQVEPLSVKMLKQIQELDPIKKPDHAKGADGPGPVDD
jgi:hypothetical protein